MSRPRNYGYSEQYQIAKDTLQRQTEELLAERRQFDNRNPERQDNKPWIRPTFHESAFLTPVVHNQKYSEVKTQEVVNKLQQILRLCKEEGALSNDEMREVAKVETQVLNFLQKTTGVEPDSNLTQTASEAQPAAARAKSEIYQVYPQSPQGFYVPQADNTVELPASVRAKPQTCKAVPQAPQGFYVPQANNVFEPLQILKGNQPSQPSQFSNTNQVSMTWGKEQQEFKPFLSEDTLEIIGHLQRRALGEIMSLQEERDHFKREKEAVAAELQRMKIEFTSVSHNQHQQSSRPQPAVEQQRFSRIDAGQIKRLREESRALRDNLDEVNKIRQENHLLKEDNQYLNARVEALGNFEAQARQTQKVDNRSTYPEHYQRADLAYGQYDSQIAVYENELKRATVVINELRSRLANIPGLEKLHDQSERIRRETTQILQLKSAGSFGQQGAAVQRLQERLEMEERGKAAFLEQLRVFKQKYLELEEENRMLKKGGVNFDPLPRPPGSTLRRNVPNSGSQGIIKKRISYLGDYEQTLNQLKNVLY